MRGVSSATVIRLALSGLACSKGADWHPATPRNFPLNPPSPQRVAESKPPAGPLRRTARASEERRPAPEVDTPK